MGSAVQRIVPHRGVISLALQYYKRRLHSACYALAPFNLQQPARHPPSIFVPRNLNFLAPPTRRLLDCRRVGLVAI